ncbi:MAG TPA: DNA cytosine methyltransferase, partial [Gammaproteobacteria bacterium]
MRELIVDNFAGGGGASLGIETALGRPVDFAINHDAEAIAMHRANHPQTRHFCESVWDVDPVTLAAGRPVGLGWFSPDCTFHSKARGGKPFRDRNRARRVRGLAWLVVRWAKAVRPRVILLENVEEFSDWGPLLLDGRPCPLRRGMTFRRWHRQIENLGYSIDMRELRACDYGAPTTRKRLFVIARADGAEIVFPEATHGSARGLTPYRTAAECIDWSIPCPSIFERKRPLAEATLRRIARGIMRYVVNNPQPFIVPVTHPSDVRVHGIDEPFRTITGAHRGELAMVTPYLAGVGGRMGQSPERSVTAPYHTITAKADTALVVPTLINTRNGERPGQDPRCRDIERPYPTVTAAGSQGALVAAFLARHYGGHENDGSALPRPFHTITAKDHHALVAAHVMKFYGASTGHGADEPLHTITGGAEHFAEVRAFLLQYNGGDGRSAHPERPLNTVVASPRFGLVTVMIG